MTSRRHHSNRMIELIALAGTILIGGSQFSFAEAPVFRMEQAKLDLTIQKYSFKLGAEQREVLKAKPPLTSKAKIDRLEDEANLFRQQALLDGAALQADVTVLQARAQKNGHPLQGNVDRLGHPLQAKLDKTGHPLQGRVDQNSHQLTGTVTENPGSPLNTRERFRAVFHLDLKKLNANLAPDITTQMDADIEKSRRRSAELIAKQEREMQPNLRTGIPHADIPVPAPKVSVNLGLAHEIQSEENKSKQHLAQGVPSQVANLKMAMLKGEMQPGKMPALPGAGSSPLPKFPPIPVPKSTDRETAKRSQREMDDEMASIKKSTPSVSALEAKLSGEERQARTKLSNDQPGLDAVLTHSRAVPGTIIPSVPNATASGDNVDVVPWDQWHARFATLARDPILVNVKRANVPSGSDTVQITVLRDHRVEVVLNKPSNNSYDNAILNAYKSLSGNPALEFPKGSRRESITFLVDNEHKGTGVPTGVQSQTSTGDREVIHSHI